MESWVDEYKFWVAGHKLMADEQPVPFRLTPNRRGELTPEIIVLHETATRIDAQSPLDWLCNAASNVSAHLAVDRDGAVTQLCPFNMTTWHAGLSSWKGRRGVNHFSIGIELVGPGRLRTGSLGHARAWWGEEFSVAQYGIEFRSTPEHGEGWWMPFTEPQIHAATAVCKVIADCYGIKDIVSHASISPGRKQDPNPLFPMGWLRSIALGRRRAAANIVSFPAPVAAP